MIISVHVPKTAGMTFARCLEGAFGERLLKDYADAAGYCEPANLQRLRDSAKAARAGAGQLAARYEVIHGHFIADKYAGLFGAEHFVAFFRDPFEQAVSHYRFLRRHPEIQNPVIETFHRERMSFEDFLAWPRVPDPQTTFLGELPLDRFAMVGLADQFDRSLALFNAAFGARLAPVEAQNRNPDGGVYDLSAAARRAVERHRARDLETWARARELFGRLAAVHGV